MICRRAWLKRGASLKIELQGVFFTMAGEFGGTYDTTHVSVAVSFDEDGAFCLTPRTRNEDGRRELGRSVIGAEDATARDLIDRLLVLPGVDT